MLPWLAGCLCCYLAVTFGATGFTKSQGAMALAISRQRVLAPALGTIVARTIGPYEAILGGWLASGVAPSASAAVATATMTCFLGYRCLLFRRRIPIVCGCAPGSRSVLELPELGASVVMVAVSAGYLALVTAGERPVRLLGAVPFCALLGLAARHHVLIRQRDRAMASAAILPVAETN